MKRLTWILLCIIGGYLVVSAVRPDVSQNWRDDWRSLFHNAPRITILVTTPEPLGIVATQSATPTPYPTLLPLEAKATPTPAPLPAQTTDPIAETTPTNTPIPTAFSTATTTPSISSATFNIVPTATPVPTATHSPTITPTSTATPTQTPTPTPAPPSGLSQSEMESAREYALQLINRARTAAGLNEVTLDDNIAAQSHAEDMRTNCFSGHWGTNGLKPYMRYTLAGGEQYSAENVSGLSYCLTRTDGFRASLSLEHDISEAMEGLMESSGHRRNILNPHHRKVNLGVAWDEYNFKFVQLFVGDYIEYEVPPEIDSGQLTLSGQVKNGVTIDEENALGIQIYYDQRPRPLTTGQLARTYCYSSGLPIVSLRRPLTEGWFYSNDVFATERSICPDPYDVDINAPPPRSYHEAHQIWRQAYIESQSFINPSFTGRWVTATEWAVYGQKFTVSADIADLIKRAGNGIYTILLWGKINGEDVPISQYSIFIPPYEPAE